MMLIPFVFVPTINIIISYAAMAAGLVPYTSGVAVPWTMPVVISGFLSTGWRGALLQALLLILGVGLYYPFIRVLDRQYLEDEKQAAKA